MRRALSLLALVLATTSCARAIDWTVEPPAGGLRGELTWMLLTGPCSPSPGTPVAAGRAGDAVPDQGPGTYCLVAMDLERGDDASHVCRLHALGASTLESRAYDPVTTTLTLVDPESEAFDPFVLAAWRYDAALGCAPACDPGRCDCPGSASCNVDDATARSCSRPLRARLAAVVGALSTGHSCVVSETDDRDRVVCWGARRGWDPAAGDERTDIPEAVDLVPGDDPVRITDLSVGIARTCATYQTVDPDGNEVAQTYCVGADAASVASLGLEMMPGRRAAISTDGSNACITSLDDSGLTCSGTGPMGELRDPEVSAPGLGSITGARFARIALSEARGAFVRGAQLWYWVSGDPHRIGWVLADDGAGVDLTRAEDSWIDVDVAGETICAVSGLGRVWCFDDLAEPVFPPSVNRDDLPLPGLGTVRTPGGANRRYAMVRMSESAVCARSDRGLWFCGANTASFELGRDVRFAPLGIDDPRPTPPGANPVMVVPYEQGEMLVAGTYVQVVERREDRLVATSSGLGASAAGVPFVCPP